MLLILDLKIAFYSVQYIMSYFRTLADCTPINVLPPTVMPFSTTNAVSLRVSVFPSIALLVYVSSTLNQSSKFFTMVLGNGLRPSSFFSYALNNHTSCIKV